MSENSCAQTCSGVGTQKATVCLPVTVCPYAVAGPADVRCCGEITVIPDCDRCKGTVNGTCEFTISQKIKVDVPVEFGATVKVGDTYVECSCAEAGQEADCFCN